jgi:hypothetical protein
MNGQEIIEMAKQAGLTVTYIGDPIGLSYAQIAHFAKLVEAKVTARYMQLFLDPENQPTQFGTATQEYREREVKDEREACAKLADEIDPVWESVSAAIRARE